MATLNPAARTDADSVKEIIETELTDDVINAFINSAHLTVQNKLAASGLGSETLADIEKWLAAHYMAVARQRQTETESVGGEWSVKYQGRTDTGLNSTFYGQTALGLDTTGTLASLGKKAAIFKVY